MNDDPVIGTTPEPVMFTFAQTAGITSMPESWLRKATADRSIAFHKVGKHVRFTHGDIADLIATTAVPIGVSPLRRSA